MELAREMGGVLRKEIFTKPTGAVMREALEFQVGLITSLPREAALRVHKLTTEALIKAGRASEIATEILKSGEVTKARANTIARTETSRTAALLLESRANSIGSTHYRWHTSEDSDVRPTHRKLNGKIFEWAHPPVTEKTGERANPGQIWNCRCFPGDTKIDLSNGVRNLWRIPFNGDLVSIVTEGDASNFSATPNHPILTAHGWLPTNKIQVKDYIVQVIGDRRRIIKQDEHGKQPTFNELFSAFSSEITCTPRSQVNFYGDLPDGDVDTITIEHLLANNWMAQLLESVGYFPFSEADYKIIDPRIAGCQFHIIESDFASLGYSAHQSAWTEVSHADFVCQAAIATLDACLEQSAPDAPPIEFIFPSKSKLASSRQIFRDNLVIWSFLAREYARSAAIGDDDTSSPEVLAEVVRMHAQSPSCVFEHGPFLYKFLRVCDKNVSKFAGHVYTLQSYSGWYGITSDKIISRNCWAEPILPDQAVAVRLKRPKSRVA